MTRDIHSAAPALLALWLAACGGTDPEVTRAAEARLDLAEDSATPPRGAAPGTCYARDRTPARIETVTEQVAVGAATAGGSGTSYRTETRQTIAGGGDELLFETPCAAQMTPDLVASLQRALAVRGHYRGPVTGVLDGRTRQGVRAYQKGAQGLDSAILSIEAARGLGLVVWDRDRL